MWSSKPLKVVWGGGVAYWPLCDGTTKLDRDRDQTYDGTGPRNGTSFGSGPVLVRDRDHD